MTTSWNNVALITGASGGIGRELARVHAAKGGDLVIVARREEALDELQRELESTHGVRVVTIAADLSQPESPQRVFASVTEQGIETELLINNAGFGGHGRFHERDWATDRAMIQLNIVALSELTHLFLQGMVQRKRGRILNVASTAAFLPGPLQATYYATKAFVLSFSLAIAEEICNENVTVTALCPGPVATGFVDAGDLSGVKIFENAASPTAVAKLGYRAMMNGKLMVFDDWKLRFSLTRLIPFLPRKTLLKISRKTMEKK